MSFSLPRAPGLSLLGTPGYRMCIAVAAPSLFGLIDAAERALAESPLIELRLDALPHHLLAPETVRDALTRLLARHPTAQVIATCRRRIAGGGFHGQVAEEVEFLLAAVDGGCSLVDLALESAEELGAGRMQSFKDALAHRSAALIVSSHDYHATRNLPAILASLQAQQPDILKLVSTANSLPDNLPILALLKANQRQPLVAIAMGEAGLPSRILGLRAGALFTFAAAGPGTGTAPGQVDATTLRQLYRADTLGSATRIFGVAGLPITHSLSPLVHNTAFASEGLDAVFLPLPTASAEDLFAMLRALPLDGVSVTMPLKQSVLSYLDHVDPLAARVGACNTIVRTPAGALHGYNTDVAGIVNPLARRIALKGAQVLVQGAGGAARAAVFGLVAEGAGVWIANRTVSTARALAEDAGAQVFDASAHGSMRFDALVNATPLGMTGHLSPGDANAVNQVNHVDLVNRTGLVFDMVYNPIETPLLRLAHAQGLATINGLEMFIHQAASQFQLCTGCQAPLEAMTRVAYERLAAREAAVPAFADGQASR